MSRSKSRRRNGGSWGGGDDVRPPCKTVWCNSRHKKRKPTEVHEAFWSFGANDKTRRLSDEEFDRQVCDEIGYMFRKSANHGRKAVDAMADLVGGLIDLLF